MFPGDKRMKKNIICMIICGVLSLGFLAGGIYLLQTRNQKAHENEEKLASLRQEQAQLSQDTSAQQLADAKSTNETLRSEVNTLTEECENLEKTNEELAQQYDTLSQDENVVYYMTILESLKKGMELVEGYLNNDQ